MKQNVGGMVPIAIILVFVCFYLLGSTAGGFLAPSLETISFELGVSEQLAGVTFLAIANGAPDVIGAIAASGSSAGSGVGLAVGALTGAGIYVAVAVSGIITILSSTNLTVTPRVFIWDVAFYLGGMVILVLASIIAQGFSIFFSVLFLVWYAIFIVLVGIEDYREKR